MTYLFRAFFLAFLFQAFPVSVQADQTARELAAQFIDLSRLDERWAQLIEIMTAGFREASKNDPMMKSAKLSEVERVEVFGVIQEEFQLFVDELAGPLRESMITFYVDRFSNEELEELIAIYESPVFVKQLDVLPELTQQNAALAHAKMSAFQHRIVKRVNAWVEERKGR